MAKAVRFRQFLEWTSSGIEHERDEAAAFLTSKNIRKPLNVWLSPTRHVAISTSMVFRDQFNCFFNQGTQSVFYFAVQASRIPPDASENPSRLAFRYRRCQDQTEVLYPSIQM